MLPYSRVPLYFFTSEIFFRLYKGLYGFIIRKTNKLIIPLIFFYVSAFLLKYIVWKITLGAFCLPALWRELLFVLHGYGLIKLNPPIWFLFALFNCNILFYLIHYLRGKRLSLMFVATLLIGRTGFSLGKFHIKLPLYVDVTMTTLPLYAASFWVRRYNFFLFSSHRFDKIIPLSVLLTPAVMHFTVTTPGMRTSNYPGNTFQVYITTFTGISIIMSVCKETKRISIVSYLGRYSIITLGIHGSIIHFARPTISYYIYNDWAEASALLPPALTICILFTPILLKTIPQLVAQKDSLKIK